MPEIGPEDDTPELTGAGSNGRTRRVSMTTGEFEIELLKKSPELREAAAKLLQRRRRPSRLRAIAYVAAGGVLPMVGWWVWDAVWAKTKTQVTAEVAADLSRLKTANTDEHSKMATKEDLKPIVETQGVQSKLLHRVAKKLRVDEP